MANILRERSFKADDRSLFRRLRDVSPRLVLKKNYRKLVETVYPLERTLKGMAVKPYYLHLELTNLCNANCVFCPYQFQQRPIETMSDEVFEKALSDFLMEGGGSVTLTPVVGDALIDPAFLKRVQRIRSFDKIDRIRLITNAILVQRFGAREIIQSGIDFIGISTSGFDKDTYERVYRSKQYEKMRDNVLSLLEANEKNGRRVKITILLRSDRSLESLKQDRDFREVEKFNPHIYYYNTFASLGGVINSDMLLDNMHTRLPRDKPESCRKLFDSPVVLPNGTVLACDCFAAMDAIEDLGIGNVLENSLGDIWRSHKMRELRESFANGNLNPTCARCDVYEDLSLLRGAEGRLRVKLNEERLQGKFRRRKPESGYWLNP